MPRNERMRLLRLEAHADSNKTSFQKTLIPHYIRGSVSNIFVPVLKISYTGNFTHYLYRCENLPLTLR